MIFGYTMHRCLCTKPTVTDFPQNSTFSNLNLTMPLLLSIFTQNFTSLGLKVPSPRVAVHHALPEGIMHRTRNADHSILINNRLVLGSSTPKPPPSLLRKNVFYHPDEGTFFREINFTKIFTLVLWQYASFFFFCRRWNSSLRRLKKSLLPSTVIDRFFFDFLQIRYQCLYYRKEDILSIISWICIIVTHLTLFCIFLTNKKKKNIFVKSISQYLK